MTNKIQTLSRATSIMNGIIVVLSLLGAVLCGLMAGPAADFTAGTLDHAAGVDPESVTSGYEVIGSLLAAFGGGTAVVFLWAGAILFGAVALYFLPPFLVGLIYGKRAKRDLYRMDAFGRAMRTDCLVKMVFNGLPSTFLGWQLITNYDNISAPLLLVFLYLGVATVLAVYQYFCCKKL